MPRTYVHIPDTTDVVWDPELAMRIRPATTDKDLIKALPGQYRHLKVPADSTVLDLGAHIGGATRLCLRKGAGKVIAVEASPDNWPLLKRNVADMPVEVVCAAAVGYAHPVTLWQNTRKCKGMHSTASSYVQRIPVQVPGVVVQDLVDRYAPAAVKINIEGAEYEVCQYTNWPDSVRSLVIQAHFMRQGWAEQLPTLVATLKQQDFVAVTPFKHTGKNWHSWGSWERRD